jgi:hypothetical protein
MSIRRKRDAQHDQRASEKYGSIAVSSWDEVSDRVSPLWLLAQRDKDTGVIN